MAGSSEGNGASGKQGSESGRGTDLGAKRPAPADIARLAQAIFAEPVDRITAPGGKGRESLRVHLRSGNVIATWRPEPARRRMEIAVLRGLSKHGAPVPRFLGESEGVFFQQDLGSRRFSAELVRREGGALDDLVIRAFASILQIQQAAVSSGLLDRVPKLGISPRWIEAALHGPIAFSEENGLDAPRLDMDRLAADFASSAPRFIKWDARPGNASIDAQGRVCWFDWEHCGRREGVEDFGWMAADEFWPLPPARSLALLERAAGQAGDGAASALLDGAAFDHLALFATFHSVQRLRLIRDRAGRRGWIDEADARRHDKIGAAPALVDRLCAHGADWAAILPATRALSPWFEKARQAIHAAAARHAAGEGGSDPAR